MEYLLKIFFKLLASKIQLLDKHLFISYPHAAKSIVTESMKSYVDEIVTVLCVQIITIQ